MVKHLKYFLFLIPFIFITNVKAVQLGTPGVIAHFNDGSITGPTNATVDSYFNGTNNYYKSPYLMGGVSSQQWVNRIDFNYNNANLCVNNDLSISGSIAGIQGMFSSQSYSLIVMNNAKSMSCSYSYDWYGTRLNFQCYGTGGGTLSVYLYMNSYASPVQYTIGVSRDMTVSCDASNLDVIANATQNTQNIINNQNSNTNSIIQNEQQNTQNIINNQNQNNQNIINNQNSNTNSIIQDNQQNTQDIIDSQNDNTQDIIDNQNQNKQDIINNQNANTDKEIESQKVCETKFIDRNYIITSGYLTAGGDIISEEGSNGVTDYIYIHNATNFRNLLTNTTSFQYRLCFYNENKTTISCLGRTSYNDLQDIPIPSNSYYVRFTIDRDLNRPTFSFDICKNGNQALNDNINDLNDSITSEDNPNTNQDINDMNNMVASDTPISDLITMPLTLINAYINGVNSSCSPINLGNLYGTDLVLPCINLEQRLGSNLWHIIDAFFSIFMCYNIGMLFITAFDGITSLRDDFEGLYQPRHSDSGYNPKHGG